jgi:hypothetical protein
MLKASSELKELDDNCTDIYEESIIDRFKTRPDTYSGICLAEFAAYYERKRNSNEYTRRRKPKVLRWIRYSREQDLTNYCREQVMLYLPWRDLVQQDCGPRA